MPHFINDKGINIIYVGDQAHFDGFARLGGNPVWITDAESLRLMQTTVLDGCVKNGWILKSAPASWADNNM